MFVTFMGVMAVCAGVKAIAKALDTGVSLAEEKKRINEQAKRLKPFNGAAVTEPIPQVIETEDRQDLEAIEAGELDLYPDLPDEEYDARLMRSRKGYMAMRATVVRGQKFADECDRCHTCGAPDPHSRAAQSRIRTKLGLDGISKDLMDALAKSRAA